MFQERKRSPLVLVGALATAGVLAGGLVAFKKGNQGLSQSLMRTRVLFQVGAPTRECCVHAMLTPVASQGATVAAMVITSGAFATATTKPAV